MSYCDETDATEVECIETDRPIAASATAPERINKFKDKELQHLAPLLRIRIIRRNGMFWGTAQMMLMRPLITSTWITTYNRLSVP